MVTWNTKTGDMAFIEHKQRISRADRLGWMIDGASEARAEHALTSARWYLVTRVAGVVAALGVVLLAGPLR